MTLSTEQYEALLARLNKLENAFNDVVVALSRLATISQMQQMLVLVQNDMADTRATVTALEARVVAIEAEPLEG